MAWFSRGLPIPCPHMALTLILTSHRFIRSTYVCYLFISKCIIKKLLLFNLANIKLNHLSSHILSVVHISWLQELFQCSLWLTCNRWNHQKILAFMILSTFISHTYIIGPSCRWAYYVCVTDKDRFGKTDLDVVVLIHSIGQYSSFFRTCWLWKECESPDAQVQCIQEGSWNVGQTSYKD